MNKDSHKFYPHRASLGNACSYRLLPLVFIKLYRRLAKVGKKSSRGRRGLDMLALIILSNIGGGGQPATPALARSWFSNMRLYDSYGDNPETLLH
jgi:hypothetical protein